MQTAVSDQNVNIIPLISIVEPNSNTSNNPRFSKVPNSSRNPIKNYQIDVLQASIRKNFESVHDSEVLKARAALYKRFYQEDRMKEFERRRENIMRQRSMPKRFIDNHMLEKVVSRRRLDVQMAQKNNNSDSLPPFSPRAPLPHDPGRWVPPNKHVYYWGC
ncbi:hypothetical protein TVAG_165260 [Trichomonas vaginalis G3]|uniref:Uncharacterized protein n=1 Tax=Trichomonas vaginalis (strain ATCC PRA-98 / G3) TaxID=412133 RepID=A2DUK7_TRIV3|nr:hypothetical protein TVAGG3_0663010 [Trichomonas vaginalis G3]EAY15898.1 hypothetical protein TVAG_165260 [Trichomonas vaginalis G3]KAI5506641.1 hypothetical protein TVAGG3_0663010 [Trichomonas vaginalis G3]|eukprot:XP_001328121.1 hypothetical protein [Trichomonas vaginalis G3]